MIIHGRVMETSKNGSQPVTNADVRIVGVWRTLEDAKKSKTPSAPNLIYVYQPLYAHRSKNTRCFPGDLNSVAADDKVLLNPAQEGDDKIQLSVSKNLMFKDLLKIDVGDPYREEILNITKVVPGATLDQPASVTLSWPLLFSHQQGTLVQRLTPTWQATFSELSEDAYRGHTTLLFNQMPGSPSREYLRIVSTEGNLPDEFHRVRTYDTKSDDKGFYQLPALQRIGQVKLEATSNGKKGEATLQPGYSLVRNQVDLVLK